MNVVYKNAVDDAEELYENAPCAYVSLHPSGYILRANQTLVDWLGYSKEELAGKAFHDILSAPGRIFYETHFAPLLRMQGFFDEVALDLSDASGTTMPVLANAREVRDADGAPLSVRIALFRARQRRQYERELLEARRAAEKAREELATLNASLEERVENAVQKRIKLEQGLWYEKQTAKLREQFVAVLGHDLRNPLASIRSGAEILARDPDPEKREKVVTLMRSSIARMSSLIDDMLDLAASRLGKGMAVEMKRVELGPVIQQVVDEVVAGRDEARVETQIDLPDPIECDEGRIGQLVSNLVGNAIDHGSEGEAVRVVSACRNGVLSIRVTNAGGPIPPDVRVRLFQPFSRAEVRAHQKGLGLGLFIASEIARAHKGKLEVESDEKETTFLFSMPQMAPQTFP